MGQGLMLPLLVACASVLPGLWSAAAGCERQLPWQLDGSTKIHVQSWCAPEPLPAVATMDAYLSVVFTVASLGSGLDCPSGCQSFCSGGVSTMVVPSTFRS